MTDDSRQTQEANAIIAAKDAEVQRILYASIPEEPD